MRGRSMIPLSCAALPRRATALALALWLRDANAGSAPHADSMSVAPRGAPQIWCGDGIVGGEEACDLGIGNTVGRDCTSKCTIPVCGDGLRAPAEACDDGNGTALDGCWQCQLEAAPVWEQAIEGHAPQGEELLAIAPLGPGFVGLGAKTNESFEFEQYFLAAFGPAGEVIWERAIASGASTEMSDLLVDDGLIIVVGHTLVDGTPQALVAAFSEDGSPAWMHRLDDAARRVRVRAAVALGDGDIALAGGLDIAGSPVDDPWLARLDRDSGSLSWTMNLGDGVPGESRAIALDPPRNRVIVAASVFDGAAPLRLIGVGEDGVVDMPEVSAAVEPLDLAVDPMGGIYVLGQTWTGGRPWPFVPVLLRFSADGALEWSKEVATSRVYDVAVLADSGQIAMAGMQLTQPLAVQAPWDQDAWFGVSDPDGELVWAALFDGPNHLRDSASSLLDRGQQVVLAGFQSRTLRGQDAWIAALRIPAQVQAPPIVTRPRTALVDAPWASPAPRPAMGRAGVTIAAYAPRAGAVFVEFGGGEVGPGQDGRQGTSPCATSAAVMPGLPVELAQAEGIVARMQELLEPYAVEVYAFDRPPAYLPYTTVMLGAQAEQLGFPEHTLGFTCEVDCGDASSVDLTLAFDDDEATLAVTAVHELGHTWGLDHVSDPASVMSPFANADSAALGGGCLPLSDETGEILCGEAHAKFCDAGSQDSHAELLARFGARTPDTEPPRLTLHAPADGDSVVVGQAVTVALEIEDNIARAGGRIEVPALGAQLVVADGRQDREIWLPLGEFELRVEAIDAAGNETHRSITVSVIDGSDSGSSGGDGGSSGGDGESTAGGDSDEPALMPAPDDGCRCATDTRTRGFGSLVAVTALIIVGVRRRRRTPRPKHPGGRHGQPALVRARRLVGRFVLRKHLMSD